MGVVSDWRAETPFVWSVVLFEEFVTLRRGQRSEAGGCLGFMENIDYWSATC